MSTLRFNSQNPIVDQSGRPTNEFLRGLTTFIQGAVTAGIAKATADAAVIDAASANANAETRQPASTSLSNLALLSGTGLVEQTGADAFTDREIGVAAPDSIPTRSDADGRYVKREQAAAPVYSAYAGQTMGAGYSQAQAQATDDAVKAASAALASLISETQTVHLLT